jgi:GT2 family glycosyltransferase
MNTEITEAPAVVAVIVANDPGPYFEEALESLAQQDYPNLSVLVVDAASTSDVKARVAAVLPNAFVRHLTKNPGYAAAANESLGAVEGAVLFLMCHDDVALEPSAVRFMVEEAYRSNAGIVTPKLVEWETPEHLITIGASADKFGMVVRTVEPGEIDQGQHDSVREVFIAPGACMLVRADLFKTLGGFDSHMAFTFEDVDFSWRAQLVGARITAMPAARVRHALSGSRGTRKVKSIDKRPGTRAFRDRLREVRASNSLRCVFKNYSFRRLLIILPQLIVLGIAESIYGLVTGRLILASSFLHAWAVNLKDIRSIRFARREIQALRQVPDSSIRTQQVSVRQRIATYWRTQFAYEQDIKGKNRLQSAAAPGAFRDVPRLAIGTWIAIAFLTFIGARGLIFDQVPQVALLRAFPGSAAHLFSMWSEPGGIGEFAVTSLPNNVASWFSAIVALFLPHAHVFFMKVFVLGAFTMGAIGMYRSTRVSGAHGQLLATGIYVVIPGFYLSLAHGSVSGLVFYATAPYLLRYCAAALSVDPFGDSWNGGMLLRCAILVAVAGAFAPEIFILFSLFAIVGLVFQLLTSQGNKASRGFVQLIASEAIAFVLLLPAAFVLAGRGWWRFIPQEVIEHVSWTSLLKFDIAPMHTGVLGWSFIAAATLVLFIGRQWRLRLGSFYWLCAIASWGLVFAGSEGWLGGLRISTSVGVVGAGACLAACVGLGVTSFFADLSQYRFGFRQLASVVAAVAVVLCTLPYLGSLASGHYEMPNVDSASASQPTYAELEVMNEPPINEHDFRVLWIGTTDLLPVRGWPVYSSVRAGVSRNGIPTFETAFTNSPSSDGKKIIKSLQDLYARNGEDVGALLAGYGIRFVVIPNGAPDSVSRAAADSFASAFDQQLAFQRSEVSTTSSVFENSEWKANDKLFAKRSTPVWMWFAWLIEGVLWIVVLVNMRRLTPENIEGLV